MSPFFDPHSANSLNMNTRDIELAIAHLTYSYPRQPPLLRSLSLQLHRGDRLALLGPTGCGKSTLLELILGLQPLQGGQIVVQGTPVEAKTLPQIRQRVGLCFQNAEDQLFMPTLLEDIAFGPRNYGVPIDRARAQAQQLLSRFGLAAAADRSARELSGGQKRLAALAATLALEPEILLLDEPTTGLDPRWRRSLAAVLRDLPLRALIVASHDLRWVGQVCDRAVILSEGQIQADAPTAELLSQEELLDRYDLPLNY